MQSIINKKTTNSSNKTQPFRSYFSAAPETSSE